MAELRPFATAKQAADIGGVTPTEIGVSATAFVRKSELVKTGKFDETSLASYQGAWFVNLDAVKKASGGSTLSIEWLPFNDVDADAMETSTFLSCRGTNNDPVITVSGSLKNVTFRVEKYTDSSSTWTHKVYLTFDKNTSTEQLTSTVTATLTDGGNSVSESTTIVQKAKGAVEILEVHPTSVTFNANETQESPVVVEVTCSGTFTVSKDPSLTWLGFSKQEDSIEMYCLSVNYGAERTGVITVAYGSKTVEVTVVQAARKISISPTTVDFAWDNTQGENIDVSTDGSGFTADVTYDDPSSGKWLTVMTEGISGNSTIVAPASKNTSGSVRIATVTFTLKTDTTQKVDLTVLQQSLTFEVSPTELSFERNGGVHDIIVNSSNAWTVE